MESNAEKERTRNIFLAREKSALINFLFLLWEVRKEGSFFFARPLRDNLYPSEGKAADFSSDIKYFCRLDCFQDALETKRYALPKIFSKLDRLFFLQEK